MSVETPGRARAQLLGQVGAVAVLLTLNFVLPRALPGDPIEALSAQGSPGYVPDADRRAALEAFYGLDRPVSVQFVQYVAGLIRGDLGTSLRYQVPVAELLWDRAARSLRLVATAVALGAAAGLLAGALSGSRRGGRLDLTALGLVTLIRSVPVFQLASMAVLLFAVRLGWFPMSGAESRFVELSVPAAVLDGLHHLALPALVLSVPFAASTFVVMRAGVVSETGADYVLTARAKGLTPRAVRERHVGRVAVLPVVSSLGLQTGAAVTGAVLVETVFRYDGLGLLLVDSVDFRDYPTIQGCFLALTLAVLGANMVADLLLAHLDPRVRS